MSRLDNNFKLTFLEHWHVVKHEPKPQSAEHDSYQAQLEHLERSPEDPNLRIPHRLPAASLSNMSPGRSGFRDALEHPHEGTFLVPVSSYLDAYRGQELIGRVAKTTV